MNTEWILCPVCGNKTRDRIREDTVLKNYPLYCPKCKQETLIEAENLKITVIQLIKLCMPPCIGKTIAAVFLCLSAVSVKGFLSWLLPPALLL